MKEGLFCSRGVENSWILRGNGLLVSLYLWNLLDNFPTGEFQGLRMRRCPVQIQSWLRKWPFPTVPKVRSPITIIRDAETMGPHPEPQVSLWGKFTASVVPICSSGDSDQPWTPHWHLGIICPISIEMKTLEGLRQRRSSLPCDPDFFIFQKSTN